MLVVIPVLHGLADIVADGLNAAGFTRWDWMDERSGERRVFRVELGENLQPQETARRCSDLIRIVARVNLALIDACRGAGNPLPRISDMHVWFGVEPWEGLFEEFAPLDTVLQRGRADCDDMVAWRLADLWDRGEAASPCGYMRWAEGGRVFHGQIRRENGLIEDPSRNVGM